MDKSNLDEPNTSYLTKNREKLSHEGHNSSKFFSNFISSSQPKKNKSSARSSKMYSMLTASSSKTDNDWNWTTFRLCMTIIRMSQNYGTFILILFGCFCFGLTVASKECQGIM